jgi:hypothetical protein
MKMTTGLHDKVNAERESAFFVEQHVFAARCSVRMHDATGRFSFDVRFERRPQAFPAGQIRRHASWQDFGENFIFL